MTSTFDKLAVTDTAPARRQERRKADARTDQWLLEIDRAWLALRSGGADPEAAQEIPAEAGGRSTRAGTTRYSAPDHQPGTAAHEPDEGLRDPAAADVSSDEGRTTSGSTPASPNNTGHPGSFALAASQPGSADRLAAAAPMRQDGGTSPAVQQAAGSAMGLDRANPSSNVPQASRVALAAASRGAGGAEARPMQTLQAGAAGSGQRLATSLRQAHVATGLLSNDPAQARAGQSALQVSTIQPASRYPGASGVGGVPLPETEDADHAEPAEGAGGKPDAQVEGEHFSARNVHVLLDEEGVHAYLRDAHLGIDDVYAIAQAMYSQEMLGQATLATLTINGQAVPRPAQRLMRGLGDTTTDNGVTDTSDADPTMKIALTGVSRHDHQRR